MCDCQLTRREALAGAALAVGALATGGWARTAPAAAAPDVPAVEVAPGLSILPRDAWGSDLPPTGPIQAETPQFLLVHHTASANSYGNDRDVIRGTYQFHTSSAKGWPDVCYQFFVGRTGQVWEGRAGALAGPVMADATGGSQGFAQLVCLIGDFTSVQPTAAARDSLVKVLAWLADRYQLNTNPGVNTLFVSRGSQRWKAGTTVLAPTIAGHRDMSFTACPGNSFYPTFGSLRSAVTAQRQAWRTSLVPAQRLGTVQP